MRTQFALLNRDRWRKHRLRLWILFGAVSLLQAQHALALSLEYLFSTTQFSSKSEVPAYEPTGIETWLIRIQTPEGKELAGIIANYRDTANDILQDVVLDQTKSYLSYLVPDPRTRETILQSLEDRDWQAATTLLDRYTEKTAYPDLKAVITAMLNTLQGKFRMSSNLIGQIPSEVRSQSPLAWLAQAHLHLESREYANCREQVDRIIDSSGIPQKQNELRLVRCCLNFMMDQKDQASSEFEEVLRTVPDPARLATEIGRRLLVSMKAAKARPWFLWALEEDASHQEAAVGLILGYIQDALYQEAQQQADQWLSPDIPEHRRLRAELEHLSGNLQQALTDARAIRVKGGGDDLLIALEANLLLDLCRPEEALALLEPHAQRQPVAIGIMVAYIRTLRDLGRYAEIDQWMIDIPSNATDPGQWRLLRAWWAYEREEFTRCLNDLQLCLSEGYESPSVYALLGAVNYHEHNRMKAEESWEKAHAENPNPSLFLALEAEANLEAKRLDECNIILKDLLIQQPNSGRLQLLQARLLDARGKHDEAILWCRRALSSGAPGRDTRLQMTESLLRGRFDREAEEQISFLMERYPESPSVLIQKAILSHRKGDFAAATEEANAVLRNGSAVERARADVLLGLMAVARDDMNAALEYAEAAIRFGAPIASPYLLRGSIRFNQLKYVAAEADFTRAIRLEPELEDGYEWRARTLQSKDLFREAIRDYTEAIRLSSTPEKMAMRHLHRAMCYIELQTWEYARIDLDRAREISPGLPEILFVQGRLAAAQGNWQEGLDALNRYLRVRQDPLAVQWRDRCLQALGRKGPAQTSSIQKVEPDATTPTTAREDIVFQAIPVPMAPSGAGRNDTAAPEVGSNSSGTSPLDHLLAMTTPEALRKIEANEVEEPSENRVAPASNQESTVAPSTPSQEEKPPASSQPEASSAQSPDSSSSQIDMSLEDLRDAARQNPGNLEIILAWVRAEKDRANGDPTSLKEANNRLLELLQADPQPSASDALLLEAWKECIERTTQLGGPQRGIIVNQTALQQFPEDTDLHLSFAKLAAHLGRIAETADSLKFVLEQEPNHIEARLLEVQWLQLQNDPDAVEAKFEELLNLAPKNPTLFQLLARYRASQKDWDRTLDACNNAISLGNDTPEIHRLRASAFSAKGDESKALEELARAAWLAPDSEETIMLRASILMEHSRFDWAFDSLAKFVEDHPDSYAPILRLCQIGWTLPNRRHKVMREWLPLAIERFPEKPGLHALQAQVFLDLNMPKEAIVAASEAVRTGPDNAANWHLLGRLKGADGQFEDARECLEQAVSIDPSLADAWSDLGAVLLQLDETEEAMLLLEKATDVQPDNPLNYYRFGLALMKGQQFARAASAFSTVRELKPEWAAAWSQNISAEIQAGNQAKAEELRAAAKQKFPGENWDAIR